MRKQMLITALTLGLTSASAAGDSFLCDTVSGNDTTAIELKEIKVVESKKRSRFTAGSPSQRIGYEDLRKGGVTDISDAVKRLSGVTLRDYGGAGGMKTVSVRGLGASHTGVIYDGVALSDSQTGEIDLSRYTLDNMRSLSLHSGEVDEIFIPARSAAGAATLIISTFDLPGDDSETFRSRLKFQTGSFGYYNPFLKMDLNSGGFRGSLNCEYIHAKNNYPFILKNGAFTTTERRNHSMMNSWKGEVNMRYKFSSGSFLGGKLYFYDNSRDLPGPVIYYVADSHEHLRDRNFFGQMNYKGRLSRRFSLAGVLKFNWSSTRYEDVGGQYPGGKLDNRYIQREVYGSLAALYLPFDGMSVDYSADWFYNNLTANRNSKGGISPFRNSILQSLAAKYTNSRLSILARLLCSLYYNGAEKGEPADDARKLSPSLNISYKLLPAHSLYARASYKNIFRLPTFNEAYFDNYGSLNLKPEDTEQYNIGVTYNAMPSGFITEIGMTVDAYYNLVRNKIVALPYNMFLWTMSNLGKVKIFGVDVNTTASITLNTSHNFLLAASYSYQRAKPRTQRGSSDWNKQVAYIPLNSGSASLTWENPWVNLVVHATGCSGRYTTNNNIASTRLGGYIDTGISLYRRFRINRINMEVRGDLLNIFNRQYEIVARYPMPGRSWKLGVNVDF